MNALWSSALVVTLASFAVAGAASSLLLGLLSPMVARRSARLSPRVRATRLFQLRVLPALCAATVAFGIALPIFLWFEPRDSGDETFGRTFMLAAAVGAVLLSRGAWRAAAGWRATVVVRRDWLARGRRLAGIDAPIPVFAIEESFPTVAVVGFSKPVVFIAEHLLRDFSPHEVQAMVLHECAHITHRDNLKRFLIRACPDMLRRGSVLDRAWLSATEEAADARAVAGNPGFALELAQALIRVARLAPSVSTLEVASAFYLGGSIEARVRQLVEPAPALPDPSRPLGCVLACTFAIAFAAAIVLTAPAIHQVMESAVRVLP